MKQFKEFYIKYKLIIWPVAVGLSSIILLALVIIPQLLTYLNVKNKINDMQKRSGVLEVKAQGLEQIDEGSNQQNLALVFSLLPKDQTVPEAMVTLQDIISRSGLVLKSTNYGGGRKADKGNSFQLSVGVSGPLLSVKNFLVNLQDAPRIFQVESISVQFQKSLSIVDVDIPISVYYEPTSEGTSSLDQPISQLTDKETSILNNLARLSNRSVFSEDTSSVELGKLDPFE